MKVCNWQPVSSLVKQWEVLVEDFNNIFNFLTGLHVLIYVLGLDVSQIAIGES